MTAQPPLTLDARAAVGTADHSALQYQPHSIASLTARAINGAGPHPIGPDAMVFHTVTGKAVRHTAFMRSVWPTARMALPVEKRKLRFHDLRHTCATLLIAAGAHAKLVQERLGHANITTTLNLYGHVLPSTEAALVDALDDVYASAR
ncbi:MAG TPA: site-specific integrase [Baekduia sp.]|uniref:site-specific integrase n=1 Tax=Baekduia sp. TaxID=2600305 RepID=UPI002D76C396|nr:site-specific integrase [Baekduia sp.]HET6506028.1 site-specific integrase [Baekduia sp.]